MEQVGSVPTHTTTPELFVWVLSQFGISTSTALQLSYEIGWNHSPLDSCYPSNLRWSLVTVFIQAH